MSAVMNTQNATRTEIFAPANHVITVNLPEQVAMDNRATAMLAAADGLLIDSDGMNEIAADELKAVKAAYGMLEDVRRMHVDPLNTEVKYINDWFRAPLAKLDQAEGSYKRKMLTYNAEQDRKRREEQVRVESAQRAERERIKAEQDRLAKEARVEAERKLKEQTNALQREKEARLEGQRQQRAIDAAIEAGDREKAEKATRLLQEATEAEARGKVTAAEAGRSATQMLSACAEQSTANATALAVMTAPVVLAAQKIAGISQKSTYRGKCVDLMALVTFVAANPQYLHLLKANDTAINQTAKAQREATKIDGIQVWEEFSLSARK